MKNLVSNLQDFYNFKMIDENNIVVLSPFYLKDINNGYPINIKKINDELIIHDGGSLVMFLNEYDIKIDKTKIQKILDEEPSFIITQNNELIYETSIDTINEDLAKYIQIITKITD